MPSEWGVGTWNSSEYCECVVGAWSFGAGPLLWEFRGQKPSQAFSSALAVIPLPQRGSPPPPTPTPWPTPAAAGPMPPSLSTVSGAHISDVKSGPDSLHVLTCYLKRRLCFRFLLFLRWFSPESPVPSGCWRFLLALPPPALSPWGCGWSPALFCDFPSLVSGKLRCSCLASLLHAFRWQWHSRPRFRDYFPSFRPARLLILALGFIHSAPWAVALADSVTHFPGVCSVPALHLDMEGGTLTRHVVPASWSLWSREAERQLHSSRQHCRGAAPSREGCCGFYGNPWGAPDLAWPGGWVLRPTAPWAPELSLELQSLLGKEGMVFPGDLSPPPTQPCLRGSDLFLQACPILSAFRPWSQQVPPPA